MSKVSGACPWLTRVRLSVILARTARQMGTQTGTLNIFIQQRPRLSLHYTAGNPHPIHLSTVIRVVWHKTKSSDVSIRRSNDYIVNGSIDDRD